MVNNKDTIFCPIQLRRQTFWINIDYFNSNMSSVASLDDSSLLYIDITLHIPPSISHQLQYGLADNRRA